ncbi:unnamed protein product [Blepharisma stoltei]|uniref:Protein kinase domain-containing protein n=1 Tax=Blepharisma stoltei TaxID=1481888 RepID=A0AAU9JYR2_9CILI|nr:unnamed protein product [Blepharisma stoltei]
MFNSINYNIKLLKQMEELITILVERLANSLPDSLIILLNTKVLIQWEKLQEIKQSILSNPSFLENDIIHLYYARYLQTFFATKAPIPEVFMHCVTLLADLNNCIKWHSFETIAILIRKIGRAIKLSSDLDSISRLVKEIKRIKIELAYDNFSDIENEIYLGLNAWRIEKRFNFDIWMLRECYLDIISILKNDALKKKTNDLVAITAYNLFRKTYKDLIQNRSDQNLTSVLDSSGKRIFNWITSIDCRLDINEKIERLEPFDEEAKERENLVEKPRAIFRVTNINQLIIDKKDPDATIYSVDRGAVHIEVIKAKIRQTGTIVALKKFRVAKAKSNTSDSKEASDSREVIQNCENEVEIYEKFSQTGMDFALTYYGHFSENSERDYHSLCIVLEYCESTLLHEIANLSQKSLRYENRELAQKFYALLDIFRKLRERKINHCDIKPQNIFIASGGQYKLGDFDLSETFNTIEASYQDAEYLNFFKGTKSWMSPELKIRHEIYMRTKKFDEKIKFSKEKSDVYSLGLTFLMMVTMQPVKGFNEKKKQSELMLKIDNLEQVWAQRLLRRMLAYKYGERPRFKDAFKILNEDPEFISCLNSIE